MVLVFCLQHYYYVIALLGVYALWYKKFNLN